MESAADKISLGKLKSNEKCFKGKSPKNRINKLKKNNNKQLKGAYMKELSLDIYIRLIMIIRPSGVQFGL